MPRSPGSRPYRTAGQRKDRVGQSPFWSRVLHRRLVPQAQPGRCHPPDEGLVPRAWRAGRNHEAHSTGGTQQEALKAFVSRRVDIGRRAYAAGNEDFPRRSVFMGNSNGAPLRDPTGSTRFVCIPLTDQKLPFEHVSLLRDAIWKRALIMYREGFQWYSTDEEKAEINRRNSDYVQIDPWSETLTSYLDAQTIYPVSYELLFNRLEVEPHQQNNACALRIRQICEAHGWVHRQGRIDGTVRRAFWPPST